MHACPIVHKLPTSGLELALKASDAVAMLSVMHYFMCMVDVRLCKCVVVLDLTFDTLHCLTQVCEGLHINLAMRYL